MNVYNFDLVASVSVNAESEEEARELLQEIMSRDDDIECEQCSIYFEYNDNPTLTATWSEKED